MSISQGQLKPSQLKWLADILMGAAHADGSAEGAETDEVRSTLKKLLDGAELSEELNNRLELFNPKEFDLQVACDELGAETAEDRRFLLKLVASITESDETHDLDESAYIRRVGGCLGASPEEYSDLTVEILSVSQGRSNPPPLPTKS
jgi:uncharacterized tellurite resistance protein B-like protein